jgi:hypothetical protein
MGTSLGWFPIVNPDPVLAQPALAPEVAPGLYWGQGTPDGDASPFLSAQKGTIYAQVNATDDTPHIWQKVDEAGADTDWVAMVVGVFDETNDGMTADPQTDVENGFLTVFIGAAEYQIPLYDA